MAEASCPPSPPAEKVLLKELEGDQEEKEEQRPAAEEVAAGQSGRQAESVRRGCGPTVDEATAVSTAMPSSRLSPEVLETSGHLRASPRQPMMFVCCRGQLLFGKEQRRK